MDKEDLMKRRKELDAEKEEIDKKLAELESFRIKELKRLNESKIEELRKDKDLILKLLTHDFSTCVEGRTVNGYNYGSIDNHTCKKCMLTEILNDDLGNLGNSFNVKLSVEISEID